MIGTVRTPARAVAATGQEPCVQSRAARQLALTCPADGSRVAALHVGVAVVGAADERPKPASSARSAHNHPFARSTRREAVAPKCGHQTEREKGRKREKVRRRQRVGRGAGAGGALTCWACAAVGLCRRPGTRGSPGWGTRTSRAPARAGAQRTGAQARWPSTPPVRMWRNMQHTSAVRRQAETSSVAVQWSVIRPRTALHYARASSR